jgi:hypothetical protein
MLNQQRMHAKCFYIFLPASLLAIPGFAQAPSDPRRTWGVCGGGSNSIHYSSLDQINRENARQNNLEMKPVLLATPFGSILTYLDTL